ncbi:LysR substrate-binding domain-containing protein [Pseudoroseomonas wenyumeiae]
MAGDGRVRPRGRHGQLSRAARELKLSQPSVSRIVGALEARLGTTLLLRTTRSLSLTDAGALYLERARRLLAEIEEAEQATRGVDSLHGVIRLAVPLMYGTRAIIPALTPFLARHPDLKVELVMSDARQNLITEGVDLAVRINLGPLDDSTFGARKLGLVERLVIAAPAYLAAHGVPATPADLAKHDCILQHGSFGGGSWFFTHNKTVTSVDVQARIWINSAPGVLAATVAGLGIALGTRVMAGRSCAPANSRSCSSLTGSIPLRCMQFSRQVQDHRRKYELSWITSEPRSGR